MQRTKTTRQIEKELDIQFSKDIKQRDHWQCVICKSKENLHCHHIIPREDRKLRYDMNNAITLCCLHHKFSLHISPHHNAFAFLHWLMINRQSQFNYLYNYQSLCEL